MDNKLSNTLHGTKFPTHHSIGFKSPKTPNLIQQTKNQDKHTHYKKSSNSSANSTLSTNKSSYLI